MIAIDDNKFYTSLRVDLSSFDEGASKLTLGGKKSMRARQEFVAMRSGELGSYFCATISLHVCVCAACKYVKVVGDGRNIVGGIRELAISPARARDCYYWQWRRRRRRRQTAAMGRTAHYT